MSKSFLALFFLAVSTLGYSQKVNNPEFEKVLESNLKSDVPEIDVTTLKQFEDVVIFDARSEREYNVSHIKGAILLDFVSFDINALKGYSKRGAYVVYCSVGSRSEQVTKLLIENGYKQTFNLYGGIFEWTNLGNPVVDSNNNPTNKVHGVTKDWAKWIEKAEVVLD
ncbi:MAG: rhodanese-like domain-containing protein [Salibacteraceae bacterium]